jgi:hypothetical protein
MHVIGARHPSARCPLRSGEVLLTVVGLRIGSASASGCDEGEAFAPTAPDLRVQPHWGRAKSRLLTSAFGT